MNFPRTMLTYWEEPGVHHALVNLRHHARLLARDAKRFTDGHETERARMAALRKMEFSAQQHQRMIQDLIVLAQGHGMIQDL
jgi:hypothetical protein